MDKTIEQWFMEFEELDDSLNATRYARNLNRLTRTAVSMSQAIDNGIIWSQTDEGVKYWEDLWQKYRTEEIEAYAKQEQSK